MRIALLIAVALIGVSCTTQNPTAPPQPAASATTPPLPVPAHYQTEADARPLPETLDPQTQQDPRSARAYRIAKTIPAVLAQQPCYCYCDRSAGHRGLLDCFRDNHGAHCAACRQEAVLAERLTKMGLSAKEVRTAIMRGDWKQVSE